MTSHGRPTKSVDATRWDLSWCRRADTASLLSPSVMAHAIMSESTFSTCSRQMKGFQHQEVYFLRQRQCWHIQKLLDFQCQRNCSLCYVTDPLMPTSIDKPYSRPALFWIHKHNPATLTKQRSPLSEDPSLWRYKNFISWKEFTDSGNCTLGAYLMTALYLHAV